MTATTKAMFSNSKTVYYQSKKEKESKKEHFTSNREVFSLYNIRIFECSFRYTLGESPMIFLKTAENLLSFM